MQQPKSGAQCGAYGQWAGPFSHQCDGKLLHNIASHSVVVQDHQLAYVGHLLADTKGHIEINFFWQKNSSKCMTFFKWPTGQHQSSAVMPSHTSPAPITMYDQEDSAQMPNAIMGCRNL